MPLAGGTEHGFSFSGIQNHMMALLAEKLGIRKGPLAEGLIGISNPETFAGRDIKLQVCFSLEKGA